MVLALDAVYFAPRLSAPEQMSDRIAQIAELVNVIKTTESLEENARRIVAQIELLMGWTFGLGQPSTSTTAAPLVPHTESWETLVASTELDSRLAPSDRQR
jgi:hypothetical protein